MKVPHDEKPVGDKYIVASHRRSGSHFFLQVLRNHRARYNMPDGTIRHWKPDHPLMIKHKDNFSSVINIVRDGRDVLVSCYHYYKKLKDIEKQFSKATFQDYLYGKIEVKDPQGMIGQHWTEQMFYDPLGYWISFVESWLPFGVLIKFEDMLENFQLPLCGKYHRKGIKGDYLNHFTNKDNQYFWSIAGDLMKKLGYRR